MDSFSMKSAAMDGRFLILAIMEDRRTTDAAMGARSLILAIMEDRTTYW
jgi:hypothetical protein